MKEEVTTHLCSGSGLSCARHLILQPLDGPLVRRHPHDQVGLPEQKARALGVANTTKSAGEESAANFVCEPSLTYFAAKKQGCPKGGCRGAGERVVATDARSGVGEDRELEYVH
jgi:hypothetical protein